MAVMAVIENKRSQVEVAQEFGVTRTAVNQWVQRYRTVGGWARQLSRLVKKVVVSILPWRDRMKVRALMKTPMRARFELSGNKSKMGIDKVMIYIILGFHKSGTTMISKMLHDSGINMVDNEKSRKSYDQDYHYERISTKKINKRILEYKKHSLFDVNPPYRSELTFDQRQQIQKLIQNNNKKYINWGFKDPRSCLSYQLWTSELPEHKIIVIYRSPNETFQRHLNQRLRTRFFAMYYAYIYINKWCQSNLAILNSLKNTKMDFLVLNYQDFLTKQSEFDRLQNFVGTRLVDIRDLNMYRHRQKESLFIKLATWLNYQRTGIHAKQIIEQLEKFSYSPKVQ